MSRIRKALRQAFLSSLLQFGMTMPIYTARLAWRFISGLTPTRAAPCRHSHHPHGENKWVTRRRNWSKRIRLFPAWPFLSQKSAAVMRFLQKRMDVMQCNVPSFFNVEIDRAGTRFLPTSHIDNHSRGCHLRIKWLNGTEAVDKLKKNCFVPCWKMPIVFTCISNKLGLNC